MKKIQLITDSASDINLTLAQECGIHVIPMNITFGDKSYKDQYEISTEEFYKRLKTEETLPKTAQVSINDFQEVFSKYADCDIICCLLSAKASGTYQNACIAKNMVIEENPDASITVVDSNGFTYGYGMWLVYASKMIEDGATADEIVSFLEECCKDTEIMLTVETLDYLQKGGRIKSSAKIIANVLDLHPILYTEDGLIMSFSKVRGTKKLIEKLSDIVAERIGDDHRIAVLNVDAPEVGDKLKESLLSKIPDAEIMTSSVGACIGVHAGPGAFGAIYRKKDI